MRKILSLFSISFFFSLGVAAHAAERTLTHYDLSDGLAPYFWQDEEGNYIGLIPDIVASIDGYNLEFIKLPRKRLDQALLAKEINFALLHPDYTEADEQLDFIPALFNQTKTLYRHKDSTLRPRALKDISNAKICARLGYKHPILDRVKESQSLQFVNSPTNASTLKMLERGRCDSL